MCVFSRLSSESWMLWSQEMYEGTGSSANLGSGPRPPPVPTLPTTSDSSSPAWDQTNTRVAPEWQHLLVFLSRLGWGCGTPFTRRGHPSSAQSAVVGAEPSSEWSAVSNGNLLWTSCSLSCVQLFGDPMNCRPSGYSVHGIFQARILKGVAIFSSRRSSQPRDGTRVCCIGRILHR